MSDASVVLVGISIVFICMIIITLLLYAFPLIFGGKKKKSREDRTEAASDVLKEEAPAKPEVTVEGGDQELIAVITAAVTAYMGENSQGRFRVASFRRVGDRASAWSKTSRLENLAE